VPEPVSIDSVVVDDPVIPAIQELPFSARSRQVPLTTIESLVVATTPLDVPSST
jgi:hypothetical protein